MPEKECCIEAGPFTFCVGAILFTKTFEIVGDLGTSSLITGPHIIEANVFEVFGSQQKAEARRVVTGGGGEAE